MLKSELLQVEALRRRLALRFDKWHAIGDEIYDTENEWVGRMHTSDLAFDVAESHNLFLPITNFVVMLMKKRFDNHIMEREIDDGGDC